MSTRSKSRIELEGSFALAPGSRAASPEGERSVAPAARSAGSLPLPGLPGGGLVERPELPDGLIDELLEGAKTAEQIAGPDGLLGRLTGRLLERALRAELAEHLGYPAGQAGRGGQRPQRTAGEDGTDRSGPGPDRLAAGPAGNV